MDLFELAEIVEKLGGVDCLVILEEELKEIQKRAAELEKIVGKETVKLIDENILLKEQNAELKQQLDIPEEDRMEVSRIMLQMIREKQTRQYKTICGLREENERLTNDR